MNEIALSKMRELEDLLLNAVKSRLKEVSGSYAVTPNTMKAAEIMVELLKIEQQEKDEVVPEENADLDIFDLFDEEEQKEEVKLENKYYIVKGLEKVIKMTRAGEAVEGLIYDRQHEMVKICFRNGFTKYVNVECDSGIALMRDVLTAF